MLRPSSEIAVRRQRVVYGLIGALAGGVAAPAIYLVGAAIVGHVFGSSIGVDEAFFAAAVLVPSYFFAGVSAIFAVSCLVYAAYWFLRYRVARAQL